MSPVLSVISKDIISNVIISIFILSFYIKLHASAKCSFDPVDGSTEKANTFVTYDKKVRMCVHLLSSPLYRISYTIVE